MHASLIVVDDFLDDPMPVRRAALGLDYPDLGVRTNFPGRNSRQRIDIPGLDAVVSRLVNERLEPSLRDAHCKCRITLAADEGAQNYRVHIDPTAHWSGILYLSLPEHCQGGTEFFRHRETNSDRAPLYDHEVKAAGAKSFAEAGDRVVQRDSNDAGKWEHTMTVPMRFNRLLLLRPWLWHTAGAGFGEHPDNGRLVMLLFFRLAGGGRTAR